VTSIVDSLATYIEACLPIIDGRSSFPSLHDPDRERLSAAAYEAISRIGWPADLSGVLDLQTSVLRVLDEGRFEGTTTNAALIAIEIASSRRLAIQPIASESDCWAKLAWLRSEMELAAADEAWIEALDSIADWAGQGAAGKRRAHSDR
jgi:hypothetical protein